ncbi:MAG: hypothetical protein ACR2QC_06555, partial [Gammaproteobacteria bacterium]
MSPFFLRTDNAVRRIPYNPGMGAAILRDGAEFGARQVAAFSARLKAETALAAKWSEEGAYAASSPPKIGCE